MIPNKYRYRRQFIAFCILVFSAQCVGALSNNKLKCSTLRNISTGNPSINSEINSFISPPFIYFFTETEWNQETRQLKIYSINTNTSEKDSFNIKIPKSITVNYLPFIALNKDYLILTDDDRFGIYRFKKINGVFKFKNKIKIPPNSNGGNVLFLTKNIALIQSIYNQHPEDKTFNTNLGIYDIEQDKVLRFIHPDLPCIGFSHMINSWITASDKLIALAHPCGYKIILCDFNLNPVDTISFHPENNWNDLPGNKIPVETNPSMINPKSLIDKLLLLQDTVSRIEKIFFVNDSTLMISSLCKNCGNYKRRIDLFRTNNFDKPFYSNADFKIEYSEDDSIDMSNVPLHLYYPSNILINDNILYTINLEDFQPTQNSNMKEFNHLKDIYYEKYDPQFSISLYKIILP